MDKQAELKQLLQKNFDALFDDVDLFSRHIPDLVKFVGVNEFFKAMEVSSRLYYRRIKDPDEWTLGELKKAKAIFKQYNLGAK